MIAKVIVAAFILIVGSTLAWADAQTRPAVELSNSFFAMDTCTKLHYPSSDIPPEAQLDLLKSLGYAGIAWTAEDPMRVRTVAEQAEQRGMKMFAIYINAMLTRHALEPDGRLKGIMEALKGHGTVIWLHISSMDYKNSSPDGDAIAVEGLRQIADQAAALDLRVAIYPHVGSWAERVQDGIRLAAKVDRKNFGVTFNLCHCLAVGDEDKISDLLKEALPHLFVVTINGADANVRKSDWNREIQTLDKGTFDVASVLQTLKTLNYQGPIGLQGYGIKGDRKENLEHSMTAWRILTGITPH